MAFNIESLYIPDIKLITSNIHTDPRGYFCETFRQDVFNMPPWVQENCSCSKKGVIRGLHYQLSAQPQAKLVQCVNGSILDVAVDIRKTSPTYGKYIKVNLHYPGQLLYIPVGFAHGFKSLEDDSIVMYKVSNYWAAEYERAIRWEDPDIGIDWGSGSVELSFKDSLAPLLKDAEIDL